MRGRKVFMDTLVAHGIERIFGNPGTTESPLIDSLIEYPQIGYVMALHEAVALGAASFYAQASGKTPLVNLHVAPGLGNALGALYSAMKANSPMVVTAGQQDTRLRLRDPVLGYDLAAMAAPLAKWSVQVEHADEMAAILRRAFKVANDPPAGPVFVALPINVMEQETAVGPSRPDRLWRAGVPDPAAIAEIAHRLRQSRNPAIVCGDDVARAGATAELVRLAESIGAPVWNEGLHHHSAFPTAHPSARHGLPFDATQIRRALDGHDLILLLGGPFFEEVWFAAGSAIPDGAEVIQIEESPQRLAYNFQLAVGVVAGLKNALQAINQTLGGGGDSASAVARRNAALKALKESESTSYRERAQKAWNREPISMPRVMAELRAGAPANAVIVDESITANQDLARAFDFAGPGEYFSGRGGAIGQGLSGALGVSVAMPGRPVVAISGDGSAMYSIPSLWTAAHHDLPIVFVILNNREYRVLKHNIDAWRQRFEVTSQHPYQNMDITKPDLGFVEIASGMGVAGRKITKPADIAPALKEAIASGKPYLLDIAIEGKR